MAGGDLFQGIEKRIGFGACTGHQGCRESGTICGHHAYGVSGSAVLASQAYQARNRVEQLRAQAEIRLGRRRPTDQTHHPQRPPGQPPAARQAGSKAQEDLPWGILLRHLAADSPSGHKEKILEREGQAGEIFHVSVPGGGSSLFQSAFSTTLTGDRPADYSRWFFSPDPS